MEEKITKRYRRLHNLEKELRLLQDNNIRAKYRLCLACKVKLLPVEKDIYCDTCLGDTDEE